MPDTVYPCRKEGLYDSRVCSGAPFKNLKLALLPTAPD
jgi:hypothetical protein